MATNDEQRKELESSIQSFRANQEHFEMVIKAQDKMLYMRYKSLMEAGFSEAQAFELVKTRGLT